MKRALCVFITTIPDFVIDSFQMHNKCGIKILGACIWWLIRQHCYMKTQGIYIHGQVNIIDVHNIYCKYVWGIKTWVFTMIVLSYYHNVWGNYVRGLGTWSTLYNVKGTTVSYLRIQYFSVLFIHEYEVINTLTKSLYNY